MGALERGGGASRWLGSAHLAQDLGLLLHVGLVEEAHHLHRQIRGQPAHRSRTQTPPAEAPARVSAAAGAAVYSQSEEHGGHQCTGLQWKMHVGRGRGRAEGSSGFRVYFEIRLWPRNMTGRPSASLVFSRSSFSASCIPSVRWFTSMLMLHLSVYPVLSS